MNIGISVRYPHRRYCIIWGSISVFPKLQHHNLFFDEDFGIHAHEIYTEPQWPSKPLFYASAPSKTDPTVAPEGSENPVYFDSRST